MRSRAFGTSIGKLEHAPHYVNGQHILSNFVEQDARAHDCPPPIEAVDSSHVR
jgi:hypothetical protein